MKVSYRYARPIVSLLDFMPNTYTVKLHHQDAAHTIAVPEDRTILDIAQTAKVDLPSSCCAGLCMTCAAQILEGTVDQTDAMGLGPELQEQGYVLLCVAQPRSNLTIETNKESEVYEMQFGQH